MEVEDHKVLEKARNQEALGRLTRYAKNKGSQQHTCLLMVIYYLGNRCNVNNVM